MSFLSYIPFIGKVVDRVFGIVDQVVEDKDKANYLKAEIEKELLINSKEELVTEFEEVTERWKSDNEHLITRLIRPLSYGFVLIVFTVIMFLDGNVAGFKIDKSYLPIIQSLLITMTVAYFGGRTGEKIVKHFKNKRS